MQAGAIKGNSITRFSGIGMVNTWSMRMPAPVVQMLGSKRAEEVVSAVTNLEVLLHDLPERGSWIQHVPVPLGNLENAPAEAKMRSWLSRFDGDWSYVIGVNSDNSRTGLASNLFPSGAILATEGMGRFLLFDIHASLGCWWLTHAWRVKDLTSASMDLLSNWHLIPSACCCRALLEGVAAFAVEGDQMLRRWSLLKSSSQGDSGAVSQFRHDMNRHLVQARFGTRLQDLPEGHPRKRTNVMTILKQFQKRFGAKSTAGYDWLCDAVHPSFGFHSVYTTTQGQHASGTSLAFDLARQTDRADSANRKVDPDVAWAVADTLVNSTAIFLQEAPKLRWLIDDIGLTTGVAFVGLPQSIGRHRRVNPTSHCPCGSGLVFQDCQHRWGLQSVPPTK